MYDPAVDAGAGTMVRAWKPAVAGIREVFHARFGEHAYPPHTHDVWTLFVVDDGAIRYDLDRHARAADRSMVSILPPHVVHDGRAASAAGFFNRVLYLEPGTVGADLIGAAVDRPALAGGSFRRQVSELNDLLACPDDAFEADLRFAFVVERIRSILRRTEPGATGDDADRRLAEAFRAYLDAHLFERVTTSAAAEALGAGSTRLARAFSAAFGIPPHRYVLGRRLEAARDRILRGQRLADVAAETGFSDQAHLTRRFTSFLGTPPGRFARR